MGHYIRDINGNYIWVDDSGKQKQVTNEGTTQRTQPKKEPQKVKRQKIKVGNQTVYADQLTPKNGQVQIQQAHQPRPDEEVQQRVAKYNAEQADMDRRTAETFAGLGGFANMFFPSHWYGAYKENKPLFEENEGLGDPVANLAFDILVPTVAGKAIQNGANIGKYFANNYKLTMKNAPWYRPGQLNMSVVPLPSRVPSIERKLPEGYTNLQKKVLSNGRVVETVTGPDGKTYLLDRILSDTNLGYNPAVIGRLAETEFSDPILQRVIDSDKILQDAATKVKNGNATVKFSTGEGSLVDVSDKPRVVLSGQYLDDVEGQTTRGVGKVGTTPAQVSLLDGGEYTGNGRYSNISFATSNNPDIAFKYGRPFYENIKSYIKTSKFYSDKDKAEIYDIIKQLEELEGNQLEGVFENTNGIVKFTNKRKLTPKEVIEIKNKENRYKELQELLNSKLPGTLELGGKNRLMLFKAPKDKQILHISSPENRFGDQAAGLKLSLYDYYGREVPALNPTGSIKSGKWANMVDAERTIGGYYAPDKFGNRTFVKGWAQNPELIRSQLIRINPALEALYENNPSGLFYVKGVGPNGISNATDMVTLQAPNGGKPSLKQGGKFKYYIPKHQTGGRTFVGGVVNTLGGNQKAVDVADVVSSMVQLTPYGFIPSALDLGMDTSRYIHDPSKENLKDIGLDVLSMLPFINKAGLKSSKSPLVNFLQNHRTAINTPLVVSKIADFKNDTPNPEKVKLTDKGILAASLENNKRATY